MNRIISPKVIPEPIWRTFDISRWLPVTTSEQFNRLYFIHQLSCVWFVYPQADHKRAVHCLGALNVSDQILVPRWLKHGMMSKEEAEAILLYALIHDIGHTAFSHATEPIVGTNNDALGLEIVNSLKKEIENCDVNFTLVKSLMAHVNPLYKCVHDKNLGAEKIDYLCRDGAVTDVGKPDSINYLLEHIYFMEGDIMIDPKAIDAAKRLQQFYVNMYKKVYLCKKAVISQRLLQKLAHHLMALGALTTEELKRMDDFELMAKFIVSKDELVAHLYRDLKKRVTFTEAIVVLYKKYQPMYSTLDKAIQLFGAQSHTMQKFIKSASVNAKNPSALQIIESDIASLAHVPPEAVLVVPVTSPERFEATDIKIYNSQKTLKDFFPKHFEDMADVGQAYATLKICTMPQYREKLSNPKIARKIYEYLLSVA